MDEKFVIVGRRPLKGEITVRGSKNAASKMMIASLLTDEACTVENVPNSVEIDITRELCETVGSSVLVRPDGSLRVETKVIRTSLVPQLSRKNRIPILALGPLLHRKGFAEVPVLGGCPIGHRPINFHVAALEKMGIKIERRENSYYAEGKDIRGAKIDFPFPSVGATENVLLTAVLAKGKTVIKNAAIEPEIVNLIQMLAAMGAKISFAESKRVIAVTGVERLRGTTWKVMPDRNEIVSFATAAIATKGEIFLKNAEASYLAAFLKKIKEAGVKFSVEKDGIRFFGSDGYNAVSIETGPHPEFMTDWQQPFCVLLTQARGESIIHETVYEDRFGYTQDLVRMGADIRLSDECRGKKCRFAGKGFKHTAFVKGPSSLRGTQIAMTDIRAGMAHIIAALAAEGESVISGIEHIDRGYERIDERLRELGADIKRV